MIITKTPYRVSFVGGGSDVEAFYSKYPGAVISTTINKYVYISSHQFFDENSIRLKYSKTETVGSVEEIQHPLFREVLKQFRAKGGLEISSIGDVPAGTGLGSSSAFTVGLLENMYIRKREYMSPLRLAEEACDIETNRLKEPNGKQDQYAAAFGGLNLMKFNIDGEVDVERLYLSKHTRYELEHNLSMFYTGNQRSAVSILQEHTNNIQSGDKINTLREMVDLVWDLRDVLYSEDLTQFGVILDKNWVLKQKLAKGITNPQIEAMYKKGKESGAIGGKVLGAGGGGFMLFYCEKKHQPKLRINMSGYKEVNFKFENEGTKLIFMGGEDED